jgi:hypothetical protein
MCGSSFQCNTHVMWMGRVPCLPATVADSVLECSCCGLGQSCRAGLFSLVVASKTGF